MKNNDVTAATEFLLTRFRKPRSIPPDGYLAGHASSEWGKALGKPLRSAIGELAAAGLIEEASLSDKLEATFTVSKLKNLLQRGGFNLMAGSGTLPSAYAKVILPQLSILRAT